MCADCDEIERQIQGAKLSYPEDTESDQYRGIVLQHAILIVQHGLRIPGAELARRLGVSGASMVNWKTGRPTAVLKFAGTIYRLEEIRKCR